MNENKRKNTVTATAMFDLCENRKILLVSKQTLSEDDVYKCQLKLSSENYQLYKNSHASYKAR